MPNVCLYFEVHQPQRLRRFSRFDTITDCNFFDDRVNENILNKVARKCYLPTNRALLELIHKYRGGFKVAFSISGSALEQMVKFAPEVLRSFQQLAKTGCVEFLGETYYHSLSAFYDENEFVFQVQKHAKAMKNYFGQTPKIFRNTEHICQNHVGDLVSRLGFKAVLSEGANDLLNWRSSSYLHHHSCHGLPLLLTNYRLSIDKDFRQSSKSWEEYPLTAEKFARWDHIVNGEVVNLFMGYDTFGEQQWEDTGLFHFLKDMPEMIINDRNWTFKTPSEMVQRFRSKSPMSLGRFISLADNGTISPWSGNKMQRESLEAIFSLGRELKAQDNPAALDLCRHLQTLDHFYYMCTKSHPDGGVHTCFSLYESPYDAFINYMNAVRLLKDRLLKISNVSMQAVTKRNLKELEAV